jgi:hypothetical protein
VPRLRAGSVAAPSHGRESMVMKLIFVFILLISGLQSKKKEIIPEYIPEIPNFDLESAT